MTPLSQKIFCKSVNATIAIPAKEFRRQFGNTNNNLQKIIHTNNLDLKIFNRSIQNPEFRIENMYLPKDIFWEITYKSFDPSVVGELKENDTIFVSCLVYRNDRYGPKIGGCSISKKSVISSESRSKINLLRFPHKYGFINKEHVINSDEMVYIYSKIAEWKAILWFLGLIVIILFFICAELSVLITIFL